MKITPEYKKKYGSIENFKGFEKLVKRVRQIDNNAANSLATMNKHFEKRGEEDTLGLRYNKSLLGLFVWEYSPQGVLYWKSICTWLSLTEDN